MTVRDQGKVEVSVMGMVLLGVATTVATGVVFLLGIYVGKGVTEERLASEQQVVRLPVPGSPDSGGGKDVEVTFWDRLGNEETKEPVAEPSTEPEPTATETTVRITPPEAAEKAKPEAAEKAKKETPTAAPTKAPAAVAPTAAPVAPTPKTVARGSFQVQVQALADRAGADKLVRDLRGRGYDADISAAKVSGKTLYRVRVGTFATEEEAREIVTKLRREGYSGAFLAAGTGRE